MIVTLCKDLQQNGCLSDYAQIYIESEMAIDPQMLPSNLWRIHRRKQAGQVHYTLIHYNSEQPVSA
jgi:16S rRNA G966 N2-methylase RsmD